MKVCTKCGESKLLKEFSRCAHSKDGYEWCCRACRRVQRAALLLTEEGRATARKKSLKWKYGITQLDYDRMLVDQGGVCAICLKEETVIGLKTGRAMPLSVDHCHKTNRVRGLLCKRHNTMIGLAKDDIQILLSAIQYLNGDK